MKMMVAVAVVVLLLASVLGMGNLAWGQADGKKLYVEKCALCHGEKGDGKGPGGVAFNPKPTDFTDPKFWQGGIDKKIIDSVKNGKGQMVVVEIKDPEIKAVIDFMSQTFKK